MNDQGSLGDFWADELRKIIIDPWYFASKCVYTQNEVDQKNPIQPFPVHFEYLKPYFKLWVKEKYIAVPKSRRMFMTWANVVLHLWDGMFHPGRRIAIVSKKEEDADEVLNKFVFILENIPETALPKELRPKYKKTYCEIDFYEIGSKIQGFPQGADQLRMFTFSRIFADEAAFWEKAEAMYSSARPTLEGGGAMTMISSPAPGFFKKIVFDELEESVKVPAKHYFPMRGVEVWRNTGNKFIIYQLHYSANEDKNDPKYREEIKSTMTHARYMQEYELSWETYEGKPVFPDYNRSVHGTEDDLYPEVGLPLLLGMDQGLWAAIVVCQVVGNEFRCIKEYLAENVGAVKFKEHVKRQLALDFPNGWRNYREDFIVGLDPSGFNRKDTDEKTYASVWADRKSGGFNPQPAAMLWNERKEAVEKLLRSFTKGKPDFRVSLKGCPRLSKALEGAYRYPEKAFEIEPNKIRPLKDSHSNIADALQYAVTLINRINKSSMRSVPGPKYSWMEKQDGSEDKHDRTRGKDIRRGRIGYRGITSD